jgi:hypothetical protein
MTLYHYSIYRAITHYSEVSGDYSGEYSNYFHISDEYKDK